MARGQGSHTPHRRLQRFRRSATNIDKRMRPTNMARNGFDQWQFLLNHPPSLPGEKARFRSGPPEPRDQRPRVNPSSQAKKRGIPAMQKLRRADEKLSACFVKFTHPTQLQWVPGPVSHGTLAVHIVVIIGYKRVYAAVHCPVTGEITRSALAVFRAFTIRDRGLVHPVAEDMCKQAGV